MKNKKINTTPNQSSKFSVINIENSDVLEIFGINNENLSYFESSLPLKVFQKGNELNIKGEIKYRNILRNAILKTVTEIKLNKKLREKNLIQQNLKMQLSKNNNLKKETKVLNSIYNDIRILSQDLDMQNKLHPSIKTSAEDLIQEMCSSFKTMTLNIFPEKEIEKITNQRLNNDVILTLKELIANVIKHANAKSISIDISKQEENIVILVQDDGSGFDVKRKEGQGLKSIRNRWYINV